MSKRPRHITCGCCAQPAGYYQQFWNQDNGFGMCGECIDWEISRGATVEDIMRRYGEPGVHFEETPRFKEARLKEAA